MSDYWPYVLIGIMPFAVFSLWLGLLLRSWSRLSCPDCGIRAPLLISPLTKTKRQWVEGGWTCPTCATDVDVRGRRVAPGTGPRSGWMIRNALLVAPPVMVAVILIYVCSTRIISQEPEPPPTPKFSRAVPEAATPVPGAEHGLQ